MIFILLKNPVSGQLEPSVRRCRLSHSPVTGKQRFKKSVIPAQFTRICQENSLFR